jgi:SagB-type dehydrogenase family enzyme
MRKLFFTGLLLINACVIFAQTSNLQKVVLPEARKSGGKPLMEALNERKTGRDYSDKKLSEQMLSDLLWAAFGINRPTEGKRTAPSAVNWQETTLYVCLTTGIYTYNAKENSLDPVISGDNRAKMGIQTFAGEAAVVLVYVADYTKMGDASKEDKDIYSAMDVGYISQNVYLYCASEGLSTVALGYIDKEKMAEVLKLNKDQKIILSQCVGYPKE